MKNKGGMPSLSLVGAAACVLKNSGTLSIFWEQRSSFDIVRHHCNKELPFKPTERRSLFSIDSDEDTIDSRGFPQCR